MKCKNGWDHEGGAGPCVPSCSAAMTPYPMRKGIGYQAWLILASRGPHFEPSAVIVLPARWCLDHTAEIIPYLKPGTIIRIVHSEGVVAGANREGWTFTVEERPCT